MEKLQYDSFYKFIVSVGILLIVVPFLLLHFWISGAYDLMISQQEFENLTGKAAELVLRKIEYVNTFCSIFPVIFIIIEILGIVLFIWGCYKWYSIQKYLDKISELDAKEKDIHLKQMTIEEKIEKMVEEVKEEDTQVSKEENTDNKIVREWNIEQLYYTYLRRKDENNYRFHRNVKIRNHTYDIIAYSRKDNVDIIYEIKCWRKNISRSSLARECQRMVEAEIAYENYAHRNKRSILVVVSSLETMEEMKIMKMDMFAKKRYHIDMEFVEEKYLYSKVCNRPDSYLK